MATLSKLKPGDVLWDVRREKMGNTTMSRTAVRPVRIIEVHKDYALVSWNTNAPQKFYATAIKKLRTSKPK